MSIARQAVKYVISGGLAVVANLVVLYVLTELFGIWYITSAAIAFVFAFFTSFTLQKLWTFEDKGMTFVHRQIIRTVGVTTVSFGVNVVGIYFLVTKLGMWYMLAQIIILGLIATVSFFVYKYLIFTSNNNS